MTLDQAQTNTQLQVTTLDANAQVQEKLRAMGFGPGRLLSLIQKYPGRPLLVGFYGTHARVGLGLELAQCIQVQVMTS